MTDTDIVRQLVDDLGTYAPNQLFIKDKAAQIVPFQFNRSQQYVHERLEEQKAKTGKVRAIILKGRQQGMSTYIGARFFHKTVTTKGILTFIFAHDGFGSQNLYNMVKMYYEKARDPRFLPTRGATNAKELLFPGLMSGYKVGTAGTGEGLGRSATFQCVHWSEVAYSPNCDEHSQGLLQTVPDMPGTEIILESTANGQNNYFHRACMNALSGVGDFQLIFVPWYWQEEYTRPLPEGFEFTPEEAEIYDLFHKDGMTHGNIAWRRAKITNDFGGDVYKFKKEYPNTPEEAFEQSDDRAYIKSKYIIQARNTPPIASGNLAPLIIGVDPARLGGDEFRLVFRQGRNVTQTIKFPRLEIPDSADRLVQIIKKYSPSLVNIDTGGLGVGVYDLVKRAGYGRIVRGISFGTRDVTEPEKYYNKRAEMYGNAEEWLRDAPVSIRFANPKDADQLQSELTSIQIKRYGVNNEILLESKEEMRARGIPSPDLADAFVLTFASSVTENKGNMHAAMNAPISTSTDWNPFG